MSETPFTDENKTKSALCRGDSRHLWACLRASANASSHATSNSSARRHHLHYSRPGSRPTSAVPTHSCYAPVRAALPRLSPLWRRIQIWRIWVSELWVYHWYDGNHPQSENRKGLHGLAKTVGVVTPAVRRTTHKRQTILVWRFHVFLEGKAATAGNVRVMSPLTETPW